MKKILPYFFAILFFAIYEIISIFLTIYTGSYSLIRVLIAGAVASAGYLFGKYIVKLIEREESEETEDKN